MPTYEYRCEKGHLFELVQRITDDPITECQECGAPVQRVFHPVAVHFKGSGFYNTDYGKAKRTRDSDKGSSEGGEKKSSDSGTDKSSGDKPKPSGEGKGKNSTD